jgi:hypothetical protein
MSSIDSPPIREFERMSSLAFVIQEPLRRDINPVSWKRICAKLFRFNSIELDWDDQFTWVDNGFMCMVDPTSYQPSWCCSPPSANYGHFAETKRFLPEPVLSHRLANVAISCIQYLHRWDSNTPPTQDRFLASWARKSKRSPWLWRRRMRVTSMRRRQAIIWNHDGHKYSFPQNLRRSYPIFYSKKKKKYHSGDFYQEQRIFYIWTLDLLYHTLRKAMKSDELTRALSKPFIHSLAPLLFPRRVKQVRIAAAAYLKKVSRRASYLRTPDDEPLH